MHQTQTQLPPSQIENNKSQRREQLKELERTLQSLAVTGSTHQQQQQRPSPSFEKDGNPATTAQTAPVPTNSKGRPNKPKKCLQLDLISISNCTTNSTERVANGVLSPWQQQPRRVPRPSKLFPVHILPNLFLGNDETAKNRDTLEKNGIRFVINVTSDLPNYFEQEDGPFTYLRVPVDDNCSCNLAQFFPEAISFIETARSEGAGVLVHCWAGISRSVTVCLAYLMYILQCTLEEAFDRLLKQNGTIAPNFHFMEALTCWERELHSCSFSNSVIGIDLPPGLSSSSKNGFQHQHNGTLSTGGGGKTPLSPSAAFNGAVVRPTSATIMPF